MGTFSTHLILLIFVKSTVLLLLAWIIASLLRNQISANVRVSIWMAALFGLLCLPVLSGILLPFTVNIPRTIATPVLSPGPFLERQKSLRPETAAMETVESNDYSSGTRPRASAPTSSDGSETLWERFGEIISWPRILSYTGIGLWLIGVLTIIGRLSLGVVLLGRLSRAAKSMDEKVINRIAPALVNQMGLRRTVRIVSSDKIQVPMVWGVLTPTVLLPESARTWDHQRLQVVLMHEFSHIRRGDYLVMLFAKIVCALYWMNPFIWLAIRKIRHEQEKACDNQVLNSGTVSYEYAEHLLDLIESLRTTRLSGVTAAVAISDRYNIKARIRAILDASINRHPVTVRTALLVLALGAVVLIPLALLQFEAAQTYQYIWLEAENEALPTAMVTQADTTASGNQYIRVLEDFFSRDKPPTGGQIRYEFRVETTGDYVIWGRTRAADDGEDSFWIRIDSGEWINWNGIRTSEQWAWSEVFDAEQNDRTVMIHLTQGPHTLELAHREENIRLDQLLLTNHLTYRPFGKSRHSPTGKPSLIWLEAEQGWLERPLRVRRDLAASHWEFIGVEDDRESREDPPASGRASYRFPAPRSGSYRVWGRIFADDDEDDSFWVRMDGGDWIRWNGLHPHDRWVWIEVFDESEPHLPVEFNLQKGEHHLEVAYREDDTRLDRLLITDDRHYYPRGYGQFNGESNPRRTELQPEDGRVTAPMEIRRSDLSGSLTSVGVSANKEGELGYADIDFAIPATDDYVILGRVQAPSGEENSFYISLDGGEEVIWHLPEQDDRDTWFWYPVSGRDDDVIAPALYRLEKGTHSLRIRNREAGTRIDQVVVCNWSHFIASFATAEGSTSPTGFQ